MKPLLLCCILMLNLPALAAPVTLMFVGDLMLDEGPGQTIAAGQDPLEPFAPILRQADATIGNLECPIARVGQPMAEKIYTFRAHPRVLQVLKGRFAALSLANNHSGDYGHAAFLETLANVDAAGITSFGGGRDLSAAHKPLWIERQGLRIAVLGYNEFKPRAFEAGPDWPGVAWSEDSQVLDDLQAAKDAGADLVLTFMHWGWEREPGPTDRQRQLAKLMIDHGAAAVIGGHPHVTQGAEIYRGRPIIYSLGNFVFDGFELPAARLGWLLRLRVDPTGVVEWDTLAARMDEQGTPHPDPATPTPCGKAADAEARLCSGGF